MISDCFAFQVIKSLVHPGAPSSPKQVLHVLHTWSPRVVRQDDASIVGGVWLASVRL